MKRAKVIHDNLNAGGGSERLAFTTIELLNEMGFVIDLATLQKPNLKEVEKDFGNDGSHLWKFNQIEIIDMYSLLKIENIRSNNKKDNNTNNNKKNRINNIHNKIGFNDKDYDLIINTHGDLFPYYNGNNNDREDSNNNNSLQELENKSNIKNTHPLKITYCHYPLVPRLVNRKDYSFLEKFFDSFNEYPENIKKMVALKTLEKYNQMMNNTLILTNSKFSKHAIERIYRNNNEQKIATIIYPPVDIERFKILYDDDNKCINNHLQKDHNSILVVSRISPNKQIENAIEVGKKLKEKENINNYNMIIVGNIIFYERNYLEKIENLITKYDLKDNIKIKTDVPFDELQKLLQRTSIYLHPTPAEPFGISIVEAMSAGLVPITPNIGGNTEFVPSRYQYQSIDHAAEIIATIINNKTKNTISKERQDISNSIINFSKKKYKENVKKVIESSLEKEQKAIAVTIK
jgi:glycosyltransferase involved in cell wall biosynthesis